MLRRRDSVAYHKLLGIILTPLEDGAVATGADDHQSTQARVSLHIVAHTINERIFRAHDEELDSLLDDEICYRLEVANCDVDTLRHL